MNDIMEKGGESLARKESDPERIVEGLWLAMQYGNRVARQKVLPPADELAQELHARIIRPVVLPEFEEVATEYRTRDVLILGATATPSHWRDIPQQMEEYGREVARRVEELKKKKFPPVGGFLDLLAYAHCRVYQIHPFLDGHKRTGRQMIDVLSKHLGFNTVLIGPEHKKRYLDGMERVNQTGDTRYFTIFLAELFADEYCDCRGDDRRYCYQSAVDYKASLSRAIKRDEKVPPRVSRPKSKEFVQSL